MTEVLTLGCTLFSWVAAYPLFARLLFRSRLRPWERFEDMTNEGAQTSCLLVTSGLVAIGAGGLLCLWRVLF